MCDAAQVAPGEHRRDGLELDRRGYHVAFCGERAKDRRGKSKVGETGQVGNGLSVSVCQQCVRVNALRGRETTRAIRAVQMSAGDKDRSASTVSVVRSRRPDHVAQQEHEHCTANMLAELAESSACDILGRESRGRQPGHLVSRIMSARPIAHLVLSATMMGAAWPEPNAKAPRFADTSAAPFPNFLRPRSLASLPGCGTILAVSRPNTRI